MLFGRSFIALIFRNFSRKIMSEVCDTAISSDAKNLSNKNAEKATESSAKVPQEVLPPFIEHREKMWQRLRAEYADSVSKKDRVSIKITYESRDGEKTFDGQTWQTTPLDVAKALDKKLAKDAIIARVDGNLWDLERPLESDCKVKLLRFDDDPEANAVFWHSTAHVLGEAMERYYGGLLCYGPPITDGFYYDMFTDGRTVNVDDFDPLEKIMQKIVGEKQPFERLELTREQLLEMFNYNQFKCRIIRDKIDAPSTTAYKCGTLIDLCRGPHVPHTAILRALKVTKNSSSYWEGDCNAESLQRVYGISFPEKDKLKEWVRLQEEAAKRDHRRIGREQELFFFHELSPGSCFFLPKGAIIYNRLMDWIREEYRKGGYSEVISPNMYNTRLWAISGHLDHYASNMFQFEIEQQKFALKPMNCPGHCVMFASRPRSHRELPLRMADFGVLHRNELSGALHGLTRVRRFCQDDAHIFCTNDQIRDEIRGCLEFFKHVYSDILGFTTFQLNLSTRPEQYLGDIKVWDAAESQLTASLNEFGFPWKLNPGDGAFYGPKIDITFTDALKRQHQCTTIQLDFQLPERFQLEYTGSDEAQTKHRPVMIHRAILGSMERFIGVFTESCAGKWPFWMSPRQICIIPVNASIPALVDYARTIERKLVLAGFAVEAEVDETATLNRKIRNAQLAQFNFILVLGERELTNGTVNIRSRDNKILGERNVDELLARLLELQRDRIRDAEDKL